MVTKKTTDPTKLQGLRRRFRSAVDREITSLKYELVSLLVKQDVFGLSLSTWGQWKSLPITSKIEEFLKWWEELTEKQFWGKDWYSNFLQEAYSKGAERSFSELNSTLKLHPLEYSFNLQSFLSAISSTTLSPVFNARYKTRDVTGKFISEKAKSLGVQLRQDLKGISTATAQRMSRILLRGLEEGWSARKIARELVKQIDKVTTNRARVLAQTFLTQAFAEGQLDGLEQLGQEEVGVRAEWHTAEEPCAMCEDMDGVVLPIPEARGLIPRHPGCLCTWEYASITQKRQPGQKRTKKEIEEAIDDSTSKSPPSDLWKGLSLNKFVDDSILALARILDR